MRIVKDLDLDLTDRHVLIVEDIIDSGLTLAYLRKNLRRREPASLEVCALLVQEARRHVDPALRYVGFRIPPDFVVGYGLDGPSATATSPTSVRCRRDRPGNRADQRRRPRRVAPRSDSTDARRSTWRASQRAVREILDAIGEDPDRDGLLDTPARVARMYAEIFAGLHEDPDAPPRRSPSRPTTTRW